MKRILLITGFLVALTGLVKSVSATPVGFASNEAKEIHLIDLVNATKISSFSTAFDINGNGVGVLQGLAIDPLNQNTLYGSTQNGLLYSIDAVTQTTTLIGDMGLGTVEAMDFAFTASGPELWVADFDNVPNSTAIYSINTSNASATFVQSFQPVPNGVARTIATDSDVASLPTKDVWVASDNFPNMDFQSIDTSISPPNTNKTFLGSFDDANFIGPKIRGMDLALNNVLYGLARDGGVYSINQADGSLTFIGDTDGQTNTQFDDVWLSLATSQFPPPGGSTGSSPVPEPSTILLLGIGITSLAGGAMRRRFKKTVIEQ